MDAAGNSLFGKKKLNFTAVTNFDAQKYRDETR